VMAEEKRRCGAKALEERDHDGGGQGGTAWDVPPLYSRKETGVARKKGGRILGGRGGTNVEKRDFYTRLVQKKGKKNSPIYGKRGLDEKKSTEKAERKKGVSRGQRGRNEPRIPESFNLEISTSKKDR